MRLICATCRRPLTRECRQASADEYNPDAQDRQPAVPCGVIVRMNYRSTYTGPELAGGERGQFVSGAYFLNPADILENALKSSGVDNGCCGSDGCDGPNRSCTCGQVLGTQWSDCWTSAEVRLETKAVLSVD